MLRHPPIDKRVRRLAIDITVNLERTNHTLPMAVRSPTVVPRDGTQQDVERTDERRHMPGDKPPSVLKTFTLELRGADDVLRGFADVWWRERGFRKCGRRECGWSGHGPRCQVVVVLSGISRTMGSTRRPGHSDEEESSSISQVISFGDNLGSEQQGSPPDRKNKRLRHRVPDRRPTRFRRRESHVRQRVAHGLTELAVG